MPAPSEDQNERLAKILFAAFVDNAPRGAMIIGGGETGSTSIDGTFNLTEVVETFVCRVRQVGKMRHMLDE